MDRRCFACTIWSEQANDLPLVDVKGDAVNGSESVKSLSEFSDSDYCFSQDIAPLRMGQKINVEQIGV